MEGKLKMHCDTEGVVDANVDASIIPLPIMLKCTSIRIDGGGKNNNIQT